MTAKRYDTSHHRLRAGDLAGLAPGLYHDGGGLWVQVRARARSWVFRYTIAGQARMMGLGPLHTITLREARAKALEARKLLLEGTDPLGARVAQRQARRVSAAKAMTFRQCAAAYIDAHQAGWRNAKHTAQWGATLGAYVYPVFGELPVAGIDTALVTRAIEPIWTTKTETASRVRGRIESVLDWATARGYRKGENPARWKGHLENLLPARTKVRRVMHHAALPYGELGAFMAELRAKPGVPARALEFAILTAARMGEAIGARWGEISLADRLWTVPAERMKAARDHRVPLSDAAMAIVEAMAAIRSGDFVFPGARPGKPIGDDELLRAVRRMRTDVVPHGFRSTFMDWATERTSFPAEMRDMALAHGVSDKVEAAYRRGDLFERRRDMMAAWAQACDAGPAENVISLRG
jgi:integrase